MSVGCRVGLKATRILPLFTLFVLAPMIGELLSGSSPPTEFFNPVGFLLLSSLYGSGAIVVREIRVRWQKDFRALLLLGAAYGIVEEGLMVKSFFDPNWMDLGILGSFGRWVGVNWVWAEMLMIYHAVFSTTIPIVLVELVFPDRKSERWTGNRSFMFFAALLALVTVIGFFLLTPYVPPLPQHLLTILATNLLICAAYKLPEQKVEKRKRGRSGRLCLAGLASTLSFFLIFWLGPYVLNPPVVVATLGMALVLGMVKLLSGFDWESHESSLNRLAIVSGALLFLIIIAPLQELDVTRKDNPFGMTLVAVATAAGLLLLRETQESSEPLQCSSTGFVRRLIEFVSP